MAVCILAIESSCDDTSVSIISDGKILSNITATQLDHSAYGGVIPELASRAHLIQIMPVVQQALIKAEVELRQLNAIAFTKGPGLIGSLIVGSNFAKGLALSLELPLIEVHHMQAHILAHFIDDPQPQFPFLCLTVSGGHTQLVLLQDHLQMRILGQTIDDAAGEAFDKAGKLLGLPYPAGPWIDKHAKNGTARFTFPSPQVAEYDFSFSGLKTSFLYFLQKEMKSNPHFIEEYRDDLCASIQAKIVSILIAKVRHAAKSQGVEHIGIAGGVSMNSELRNRFEGLGIEMNWKTYIPAFQYCTDNAGMIAITAHYKYLQGDFADQSSSPDPKMPFMAAPTKE